MKKTLVLLFSFASMFAIAQDEIIVSFESNWKYFDNGTNPGFSWRTNGFDDSTWAEGPARLGYGNDEVNTMVSFGADANDKHITTFFRHHFTIDDVSDYKSFLLKMVRDDGAVVYINGQEVMRSNFGLGLVGYLLESETTTSGEEEGILWEDLIPASVLQTGENVIAVEVHQDSPESSDMFFDLELTGMDANPSIYREPYLQKATTDGITVMWKTDIPTDSKIWYGTDINSLDATVESLDSVFTHELTVSGLEEGTAYFYKVGSTSEELTSVSSNNFFTTQPALGTSISTRIWVTGDHGTGKDEQFRVRDAYLDFAADNGKADIWLMLGDNAYEHGRESEFHPNHFLVYPEVHRNTVSYSAVGNHELQGEASSVFETGPFYDIFSLPEEGESGGVASGKESYFSFDHGNIHFVCLESLEISAEVGDPMATWLTEDLENTNAEWLIAYWHLSPYTKLGHDSDEPDAWGGQAPEMRENILPILEEFGVDIVLSGHSHGYERSYLVDGHYGFSSSLDSDMILDDTSGNLNMSGAYLKPEGLTPHNGTVYIVCGSSGKLSSINDDGPHPVMYTTSDQFAGSMIIDVEGSTLEANFLNENGLIEDTFHIVKGPIGSTNEASSETRFILYPNPSDGQMVLEIPAQVDLENTSMEIYDSKGALVSKRQPIIDASEQMMIDLRDLATGAYTLRLSKDGQSLFNQIVVIQ